MDRTEAKTGVAEGFATLVDEIIDSYFAFYPNLAARQGLHEYDGRVADYGGEALAGRAADVRAQLARLKAIDPADLDDEAAHDHALVRAGLAAELWRYEDFRGHALNPLSYQFPIDVSVYVKRNYAPLAQRLDALTRHLEAVPGVLQ